MNAFQLLALAIFAFGLYASAILLRYRLRDPSGPLPEAVVPSSREVPRLQAIDVTLLATCVAWFAVMLALVVTSAIPGLRRLPLQLVQLMLATAFPPMIMHSVFVDYGGRGTLAGRGWRIVPAAWYVASIGFGTWCTLGFLGLVPAPESRPLSSVTTVGIGISFTVAAVYSIFAVRAGGRRQAVRSGRSARRSMTLLFCGVVLLALAFTLAQLSGEPAVLSTIGLLMSSMPLAFFFVGTWTEDRFRFFDLFVKRGLAFLVTLAGLAALIALLAGPMEAVAPAARPWLLALALLPAALALPWVHRALGRLLDAWWFGRPVTPGEAMRDFLTAVQGATDEASLVDEGERALGRIFRATARIALDGQSDERPEIATRVDVRFSTSDGLGGAIRLGPRASHAPYFSEDVSLLRSIAGMLARTWDTVRLQRRRIEQEQRHRELSLQASRSELKALRAQINPHFLFNALNAIAGLIHRDPARADATVEQLSEVFRYTLRRSQTEWVLLEDEMDFARAYLEVERARFGDRMQVEVRVDDDVSTVRVPTMTVQTLVENAVKHGVARLSGPARVEISACARDGRLLVEVADSGPGFAERPSPATDGEARGAGFGLDSVRRRLAGHFGDRAGIEIVRDEQRGMTCVRLSMPARAEADVS